MAYGKIKADVITHHNTSTNQDDDVTVASIVATVSQLKHLLTTLPLLVLLLYLNFVVLQLQSLHLILTAPLPTISLKLLTVTALLLLAMYPLQVPPIVLLLK